MECVLSAVRQTCVKDGKVVDIMEINKEMKNVKYSDAIDVLCALTVLKMSM